MPDEKIYIRSADGVLTPVDTRTTTDGDNRQVVLLGDGENAGIISPATEGTLSAGLGTDGAAAPSITGTGVRGWLRAIYDRLVSGVTVTVTNPTTAPETGLAKDATLSSVAGGPGSSPPSLPGSGTGLLGYLRAIRDLLAGTLTVTPSAAGDVATSLTDGRKTVTTPATPVVLGASTPCKWVQATALTSNTDQVNVGGSGVLATAGSSKGTPLAAGQSTTLPVSNLNLVFVDARVAGEGVSFTVGA
jgi:hypothetical protein